MIYDITQSQHDRIMKRWDVAAVSYKWDTNSDHGYNSKTKLPAHLQYCVESKEMSCFAINEVEWCNAYCKGQFARRYSTSKDTVYNKKRLCIMAFQYERDALAFEAYLLFTSKCKLNSNTTASLKDGGVYHIPCSFNFIHGQFSSDKKTDNELVEISKWCLKNCEGDYVISRLTLNKFIWFEKASDLIYFKLSNLFYENNES